MNEAKLLSFESQQICAFAYVEQKEEKTSDKWIKPMLRIVNRNNGKTVYLSFHINLEGRIFYETYDFNNEKYYSDWRCWDSKPTILQMNKEQWK